MKPKVELLDPEEVVGMKKERPNHDPWGWVICTLCGLTIGMFICHVTAQVWM